MTAHPRMVLIHALLSLPDPPELPLRAHVWTQGGKPDRYTVIPQLSAAFVQWRLLEMERAA